MMNTMLANANALYGIVSDASYDKKIDGHLLLLQEDKWRKFYALVKSNMMFLFDNEAQLEYPALLILIEDCLIEPSDDNYTGRQFTFSIKFRTTGRVFIFAAFDFKTVGNWISVLTICSHDYMLATKQFLQEKIDESTKTAKAVDDII